MVSIGMEDKAGDGLLARMAGVSLSDYISSESTDGRNAGVVCWLWGELGRHG